MQTRSIIHVDMDAFFAAIEELDDPSLRGKPVIIGGTPEGHGVVSTANYVAREYGIRSAMPAAQAVKLCPQGVFLRPRSGRYAEVSRQIFEVFRSMTPVVEPLSIDEAFLDVSGCAAQNVQRSAAGEALALQLQKKVEETTGGLTCSAGVAENKFLAKVASDLRKPRGLVVVPPGGGRAFLEPLSVQRLWGVGPKTAARLHALSLRTVGDLARMDEPRLVGLFGADFGAQLYRLARGIDDRPVVTEWESKSISQETTLAEFLPPEDDETVESILFGLSDGVAFRLRREALWGRTVHLKVRDDRFRTMSRAVTLESPTRLVEEIFPAALRLYRERVPLLGRKIRLLGVGVTGLVRTASRQLDIFEDSQEEAEQARRRAEVSDAIRSKLGDSVITRARLLEGGRGHTIDREPRS